jgi:hypothetical protein
MVIEQSIRTPKSIDELHQQINRSTITVLFGKIAGWSMGEA